MHSVRHIASQIVAREGGFVDDPDDPGGATKHGVTIGTLKRLGLDLNGDGLVGLPDLHLLEADQAIDIFLTHYFTGPGIGAMPAPLQPSLFDMYVNAGRNAVVILQRLLSDMGFALAPDGVIGAKTIAACQTAHTHAPDHLVDAYGIARRNYYYRLGDRRVKSRKYARRQDGGKGGWITRAEEFISQRFHLTDAEHRERIAAWD